MLLRPQSLSSARQRWSVMTVVAMIAALLAFTGPGASGQTTDAPGDTTSASADSDYLIVQLRGSALAHRDAAKVNGRFDPTSQGYSAALQRLQRQHRRFVNDLAGVAPNAEVVSELFITANAVVVKLNGSDRTAIQSIRNVKKLNDSQLYTMSMNESVKLIDADDYWAATSGQADAGAGVRIGVIDSGIVNSLIPGFHSFFNCKTVEFGGIYFSGVTGEPGKGTPGHPAPGAAYVFDHGTHVAGTAGGCIDTVASGPFAGTSLSGVAPGATLVDYNVFPGIGAGFVAFGGSAFSHDIANAIEDSVANGDHVINMSLGGGVQGPHDFLAEVSNAAMAAGTIVVTSAGNEGPGAFTVGSPGSASEVIAVGATTNSHGLGLFVTEDPGGPGEDVYPAVPGDFANFDGSVLPLVVWSGSDFQACTSSGVGDHTGEVVLISRGSCSFTTKIRNAENAGAVGVIVYNNVAGGAIGMGHDGTNPFPTIPAVMVTMADGQALVADAPSTVSITPPIITAETPDELIDFSSRGPAPFTYEVKPDVVAPGVNILSSIFFGFDLKNGTSMASPHVAGAAAALLAENPGWTPEMMKSALVTTATRLPGLSVWEQGGGLISLTAAHDADTFFYPANASFGGFIGKAKRADGSVDIAISGAGGCSVDGVSGDHASASVNGSVLTVEFNGGRHAGTDMYNGYVDLTCSGISYHIPWGAVVDRR